MPSIYYKCDQCGVVLDRLDNGETDKWRGHHLAQLAREKGWLINDDHHNPTGPDLCPACYAK